MDQINKFLLRLSQDEFLVAENTIKQVLLGDTRGLHIKKLKGTTHVFRVRKGALQIIFLRKNGVVRILEIDRRGEGIYRNFTHQNLRKF